MDWAETIGDHYIFQTLGGGIGDVHMVGRPADNIRNVGKIFFGNLFQGVPFLPLIVNSIGGRNGQPPAGSKEGRIIMQKIIICPQNRFRLKIVKFSDSEN